MIVISGTGRSGTSFTARLLSFLGHSLGRGPRIGHRKAGRGLAGGEDAQIAGINKALVNSLPVDPSLLRGVASCKDAVKDPYFCYTLNCWAEAGAKIDLVVVCWRDFTEAAASAVKTGLALVGPGVGRRAAAELSLAQATELFEERYAQLMRAIETHDLPYTKIEFPRSVQDQDYAYEAVGKSLGASPEQFAKAWGSAIDPNYKP